MVYDPQSPEVLADPFPAYRELRGQCPVAHVANASPPYHVVSRYDDVADVLRQPKLWVNRNGHGPGMMRRPGAALAYVDAPDHTRQRRIVQRAFSPHVVAAMADEIDRIANDLVDRFGAQGSCDLHDAYSYPLPVIVIARLLGVAEEMQETFKRWSDDSVARLASGDPTSYRQSADEFAAYFLGQLDNRRSQLRSGNELPNDLLSGLVTAEIESESVSEAEMLAIIGQLLTAGNETTTSLINNMIVRLCERPELLARVQADPTLDAAVVEESLRFDAPVLGLWRTNDEPVELHGTAIPVDTKVQALFASANRDERVFERPDEFHIDRPTSEQAKHLAFGFGPHVCLGAPLARLEGRRALRVLLDRLPGLRLNGTPQRVPAFFLWGFSHTPIAWDRR